MGASTIAKQARRSAGVSATRRVAKARRHFRLRKKVAGTAERPRLVVSRSARHLFAQLVDDGLGVTLASVSTFKLGDGDKTAKARQAGSQLAEAAKAAGVSKVVFDRGGNTYTGRIAAFADAAREAGLEF
ncbi:50S ribosomal protein L18 [Jatrophihabitans cynanchi]|jgi:large subunit ribosomal protein L18|uniref:Large ribosomal subunit protein uL18 n=1 Tax=Jatrophihabitans cynanchi TaxID=2944128 RepID=A0ABY7K1Y7_9ACTN|nr:50S ribosomal protein L18 [Jatrophihabitans sp. SB3-54]WAX58856.1 50S ribosomal protein L18 [Jatrophihabitans sp. SB3-54]